MAIPRGYNEGAEIIPFKYRSRPTVPYAPSHLPNCNFLQWYAGYTFYCNSHREANPVDRMMVTSAAGTGKSRMYAAACYWFAAEIESYRKGYTATKPKYHTIRVLAPNKLNLASLRAEFKLVLGKLIRHVNFTDKRMAIESGTLIILDEFHKSVNDGSILDLKLSHNMANLKDFGFIAGSATPLTNDLAKLVPFIEIYHGDFADPRCVIAHVPSNAGGRISYWHAFYSRDELVDTAPLNLDKVVKTVSILPTSYEMTGLLMKEYIRIKKRKAPNLTLDGATISYTLTKRANPHGKNGLTRAIIQKTGLYNREETHGKALSLYEIMAEYCPLYLTVIRMHEARGNKLLYITYLVRIMMQDFEWFLKVAGYTNYRRASKGYHRIKADKKYYFFPKDLEDIVAYSNLPEETQIICIAPTSISDTHSYGWTGTVIIAAQTWNAASLHQKLMRVVRYGMLPKAEQAIIILASHSYDSDGDIRYHHEHRRLKKFVTRKLKVTSREIRALYALSILKRFIPATGPSAVDNNSAKKKAGKYYEYSIGQKDYHDLIHIPIRSAPHYCMLLAAGKLATNAHPYSRQVEMIKERREQHSREDDEFYTYTRGSAQISGDIDELDDTAAVPANMTPEETMAAMDEYDAIYS